MLMKGTNLPRNLVVRSLCIPHTKPVVMLRRKTNVLRSRLNKCFNPLVWMKIQRIKRRRQIPIITLESLQILGTIGPTLNFIPT